MDVRMWQKWIQMFKKSLSIQHLAIGLDLELVSSRKMRWKEMTVYHLGQVVWVVLVHFSLVCKRMHQSHIQKKVSPSCLASLIVSTKTLKHVNSMTSWLPSKNFFVYLLLTSKADVFTIVCVLKFLPYRKISKCCQDFPLL